MDRTTSSSPKTCRLTGTPRRRRRTNHCRASPHSSTAPSTSVSGANRWQAPSAAREAALWPTLERWCAEAAGLRPALAARSAAAAAAFDELRVAALPADSQPFAKARLEVAEGDAADVDLAAKAAHAALYEGPWGKMDARDRGALMYKLADLIEQDLEGLAALESLDNGKPIADSSTADLALVVDCLRYYAGWADKIHGKTIPVRGDFFVYTRRAPVGVAGQLIRWIFPMLLTAWKWGPALAAGCTVVMKPAEQTPLTCLRMAKLAQEAGFPDGVINIVPGFGPTAGLSLIHI